MPAFNRAIPVNIVMGELGSGKTTVILSLIKQIAGKDFLVIWLKNEYGDVNVDGMLAKERGIKTEEVMNGCLCCTAVGKIEGAILEILKKNPDRIIIETAGTAHPAPIVMELKRFPNLIIDSVLEIVDAVHFGGFSDQSVIGKSHARYVDFIIVNKTGLVDENRLEVVRDRIYENYPQTPQMLTRDGFVSADVLLGLEGESAATALNGRAVEEDVRSGPHVRMEAFSYRTNAILNPTELEEVFRTIPISDIYRVKGVVRTEGGWKVVNRVATRTTWQPLSIAPEQTEILFIGPDAKQHEKKIRRLLDGASA